MKTFISESAAETRRIGRRLASSIRLPATLALWGELGSGKTQFTKGLAEGLGVKKLVQSPTFLLYKEYPFRRQKDFFRLCHFDFYRLKTSKDTHGLQLAEILHNSKSLNVVEWPALIRNKLPPNTHSIYFRHGSKPHQRKIRIPSALAKII